MSLPLWAIVTEEEFLFGTPGKPFPEYHTHGVQQIATGNRHSLELVRLAGTGADASSGDIYLPFEDGPLPVTDPRPIIMKSVYRSLPFPDAAGKAASFESSGHSVVIDTPPGNFIRESAETGRSVDDFSIFFRFRPYQLRSSMPVLTKVARLSGITYGLRINWENGHLNVSFLNVFTAGNMTIPDVTISTTDAFSTEKFQSVLLNYHAARSELALYVAGREQDRKVVTGSAAGIAHGNPLIRNSGARMQFHRRDHSRIVIGRGLLGALDEVSLQGRVLDPSHVNGSFGKLGSYGDLHFPARGIFISKRLDGRFSRSVFREFRWAADESGHTRIKMFFRCSDLKFAEDTPESVIPWLRLLPDASCRGRYGQFRTELLPDNDGASTPRLSSFSFRVLPDTPPAAPRMVRGVMVQGEVEISFMRNPEMDVITGGRYFLYYGLRAYQPSGRIMITSMDDTGNAVPITDSNARAAGTDPRTANRLVVRISNRVIEENIRYTRDNPALRFPYPALQPDVGYFFWVTAADASYSERPEHADHESAASEAVFLRYEP